MGSDEYHPIGHSGSNLTEGGGIGYTVVDSIDTMVIMGLDEEYVRARKWVEETHSFDVDGEFNTFEVRGGCYASSTSSNLDMERNDRRRSASLAASSHPTTSHRTRSSLRRHGTLATACCPPSRPPRACHCRP